MKKYKTSLLFILCSIFFFACNDNNASSGKTTRSSVAIDSLFAICRQAESLPMDSLEKYTRLAYELVQKEGTDLDIVQGGFYRLGYFVTFSHIDSAVALCKYLETLPRLEEDPNFAQNKIAVIKASILHITGKSQEALDWAFQVMPQLEASKDSSSLYRLYNNVGVINVELNRKEEAIKWYRKIALSPSKRFFEPRMIAALNIADAYVPLHQLDSATKYANIALEMSGSSNNLLVNANAKNILGKVYAIKKDYGKAEKMVAESALIREQIGDPYYIIADKVQLSDIYNRMKQFDKSRTLALEALELAQEHKIENQDQILYTTLINSYYDAADYKEAADHAKKLIAILYDNSKSASPEAFAELEVKYETAKKEQKIQEQKFIIEKKNTTIIVTMIIIILICLIAVVIFQYVRNNQKQKLQAVIIKEQDEAAKAVINAEEQERSRMSQNLHDGVGQLLSGLKMNLEALGERLELKENEYILKNSISLLNESITEIRDVSHQILPNNIIRMGLINALKSLIGKIDQNKIQIDLQIAGILNDIHPDIQLMVYRILQEGINNILKHAKAKKIEISISINEQFISAIIKDDGIGFETKGLKAEEGIGLSNISSRIRFLKGTYIIKSIINEGTTLQFDVPLKQ